MPLKTKQMQAISVNIGVLLMFIQLFVLYITCFYMWFSAHVFNLPNRVQSHQLQVNNIYETSTIYSTEPPLMLNCSQQYKVAFTFDDGPHPTFTPLVVKILNRQKVKAGFFLLGTAIQSFLSAHNNLSVHQFERPRLGFLLLQDYSLVERLLEGHDIYLHGWLHEKINEMRLQTVVDNIATQLIEIGHLKEFKPIYRAPWGLGTGPGNIRGKGLLTEILDQMGILPTLWNIDTKDYFLQLNENKLINNTLQMICRTKGGHMLMHDNRPSTSRYLDRMIRSIRASGHSIVSPGEIDKKWNDQKQFRRTKKYTEYLRKRIKRIQSNRGLKANVRNLFRPVEITLFTLTGEINNITDIDPIARYEGKIKVSPNINDA